MNKQAAEKIAQEYYDMGLALAFSKVAAVDYSDIQDAMRDQRALFTGDAEERMGSTMEQRRREGAIGGTMSGGALGAILGGAAGSKKGKALALLGALLGAGAGGAAGNLLGRGAGLLGGSVEGGLASLPGVRGTADFLSQPLNEY